jgi:hypothetical protein
MARRKAHQLELPMPLADGIALREQLARAREELAQLREDAAQWAQHFTRLDRERYALLRERDAARAEVQSLQLQLQTTRLLLDLQSHRESAPPAVVPTWLTQALRKLLALTHPDKWSAGQNATTLAHELTVELNALRHRLGEVT